MDILVLVKAVASSVNTPDTASKRKVSSLAVASVITPDPTASIYLTAKIAPFLGGEIS